MAKNSQVPSVQVGNQTMYVDSQGGLHKEPSDAIAENMRVESDQSRGASGGCNQDPAKVPTDNSQNSSGGQNSGKKQ